MARVGPADGTGEVATRLRRRRNGHLTPLDDVLLHSPPLADGWNSLLGAVRTQLELADDLRELTILRVATLNGADYEWDAHEPLARKAGLSDSQIAAIGGHAEGPDSLSSLQHLCLRYTDEMTKNLTVSDTIIADLVQHLGERQVVELTATIGTYNLVSRFLVAMGIEQDPGALGAPD